MSRHSIDSITLRQPADSCQTGDDEQTLRLNVLDAGGGPYVLLTTGPNGWALDEEDLPDLMDRIKDLIKQAPK